MAKDIILINPPVTNWGRVKRIRATSPPLGLLSLAALVEKRGHDVDVLDLALQPEKLDSLRLGGSDAPQVVGITSTTNTLCSGLKIAEAIRKRAGNVFIVFGGPHPSARPLDVLENDQVDCVVMGEGEITFEALCACVRGAKDWRETRGIAFIQNGKLVTNPPEERIRDLDALPFPARQLVPLRRYEATPINYRRRPTTPVITSRGCPFPCTFCSNSVHGQRTRFRSPESVVRELFHLKEAYGVRDVSFWDDTFTLNRPRVGRLCGLLNKEGLALSWSCTGRVDTVDQNMLHKMKQAGCWQIAFGVESGVERLREKLRKGVSEEQILKAFAACRKAGIETRAFFMLGIPTETREESRQTIEFAKRLKPDFAQFTLLVPYPGSELFEEEVSRGWLPPAWQNFQTYPENEPVYVPEGRSASELLAMQTRAFKSFHFRPAYLMNRLVRLGSREQFTGHVKVFFEMLGW